MIKNWNDFNQKRVKSLEYHKLLNDNGYSNALTYFELMRLYFEKNGFPEPHKEVYKSGIRKGQPTNFTEKESKEQMEKIHEFIKNKRLERFRNSRQKPKRRTGRYARK